MSKMSKISKLLNELKEAIYDRNGKQLDIDDKVMLHGDYDKIFYVVGVEADGVVISRGMSHEHQGVSTVSQDSIEKYE
jgi:hypothetical protein